MAAGLSVTAYPFVFCELKTKRYRMLRGEGGERELEGAVCWPCPKSGNTGTEEAAPFSSSLSVISRGPKLDGPRAHRSHEMNYENVFNCLIFLNPSVSSYSLRKNYSLWKTVWTLPVGGLSSEFPFSGSL